MRRLAGSWLATSLFAGLAFGLVAVAGATVPPPSPCPGIQFVAAPAPIEAGRPAIRLVPNRGANGVFSARLVAATGLVTALAPEGRSDLSFLLRPDAPVLPGVYSLEYSDACADGPIAKPVAFESAPLPRAEDFPSFDAVMTHNCRLVDSIPLMAQPWLELKYPKETTPFLPFSRVTVNGTEFPFFSRSVSSGDRLVVDFLENCGLGKLVGATRGTSEFTLTLAIIDGPEIVRQTASVTYDCFSCPDPMPPPTTSVDAGMDATPVSVSIGGTPLPDGSCQCAFARVSSDRLPASWSFVLLTSGAALVQRRRRARPRAERA